MKRVILIIAIVFSGMLIQAQTQVYELESGKLYISSETYHGEAILWFTETGKFTNYFYLGVDNNNNLRLKRSTGNPAYDGVLIFRLDENGYAKIKLIGQPMKKQPSIANVAMQVIGNELTIKHLNNE